MMNKSDGKSNGLFEMPLEDLRKIYDFCQTELTKRQNQLDELQRESERERREWFERTGNKLYGFLHITGLEGLCNVTIDDCKKTMAEIEAEVKRRGMDDEFKKDNGKRPVCAELAEQGTIAK